MVISALQVKVLLVTLVRRHSFSDAYARGVGVPDYGSCIVADPGACCSGNCVFNMIGYACCEFLFNLILRVSAHRQSALLGLSGCEATCQGPAGCLSACSICRPV